MPECTNTIPNVCSAAKAETKTKPKINGHVTLLQWYNGTLLHALIMEDKQRTHLHENMFLFVFSHNAFYLYFDTLGYEGTGCQIKLPAFIYF